MRNFRLQNTYTMTHMMNNTGITAEGTITFIWSLAPVLLLPILACEDEVAEEDEAVGVDVGDSKTVVDNIEI